MKNFGLAFLVATLVLAALAGKAWGYLMPLACEPGTGAQISNSPKSVVIRFDGKPDPAFSTVRVYNAKGEQMDNRDAHVSGAEGMSLLATLPPLPSGTYRVRWTAQSFDGQETNGEYTFTVQ